MVPNCQRLFAIYGRFPGHASQLRCDFTDWGYRDHWGNLVNVLGDVRPSTISDLETIMMDRFGNASRHIENLHKILTMRQNKQTVREFARDLKMHVENCQAMTIIGSCKYLSGPSTTIFLYK